MSDCHNFTGVSDGSDSWVKVKVKVKVKVRNWSTSKNVLTKAELQ